MHTIKYIKVLFAERMSIKPLTKKELINKVTPLN